MSKLWIYNTNSPYGEEKHGGVHYFKVVVKEGKHDFIIDAIRDREEKEAKKFNQEVVSSLRQLKDGDWLLRLRVKYFRSRCMVKMDYRDKTEQYLKTYDELTSSDELDVQITLGDGFIFNWNGESRVGLNIYLDKVVV